MPSQATETRRVRYAEHGFICSVWHGTEVQNSVRARNLLYHLHKTSHSDSFSGADIDFVTHGELILSV
jgi:hypothetical protein